MDDRATANSEIPLVVDLDRTLFKVDTFHEALIQMLARRPIQTLRLLLSSPKFGASLRAAAVEQLLPDTSTIPTNDAVIAVVRQAKEQGRKVYLITAGDRRFADAVAASLGNFDGVFASQDGVNFKAEERANRLVAAFGPGGFDYIGNNAADIPIWQAARTALVSQAPLRLVQQLRSKLPGLIDLNLGRQAVWPYLLALRPHQWLKNGLVALPTIAAHKFSITDIVAVVIALASFSFAASSVYLINDMIDLPLDRAHPAKRQRALATGEIALRHVILLAAFLAIVSFSLALMLPRAVMLTLITYIGFSVVYSLYLKRKLMIDVVALAGLYGIRVLAGGAATGIVLSHWLVGFCFFIFLSLALVKRMSEMIAQSSALGENVRGRGYRREDLQTISAITAASGLVAVLVFALYINSSDVRALYQYPEFLWGICVILVYWLGRVYFLAGRGEMHQDPVIFAATDRVSLLTGVIVTVLFILAL
jgi:4-hydroxybenzoate polyprenyltransferase/phosphoserine phosphatase